MNVTLVLTAKSKQYWQLFAGDSNEVSVLVRDSSGAQDAFSLDYLLTIQNGYGNLRPDGGEDEDYARATKATDPMCKHRERVERENG